MSVLKAMPTVTEYRVISASDGWITEYNDRDSAEERADQLNNMHGVPDDHYVKKYTEVA